MNLGRRIDETLAHVLGRVIFTAVDDKIFNALEIDDYEKANENFHKLDLFDDVADSLNILWE